MQAKCSNLDYRKQEADAKCQKHLDPHHRQKEASAKHSNLPYKKKNRKYKPNNLSIPTLLIENKKQMLSTRNVWILMTDGKKQQPNVPTLLTENRKQKPKKVKCSNPAYRKQETDAKCVE